MKSKLETLVCLAVCTVLSFQLAFAQEKAQEEHRRQDINVDDAKGLELALEQVKPGQVIVVKPGRYELERPVRTKVHGSETRPITLRCSGDKGHAVLVMTSKIGFRVQHHHWVFDGIHFQGDVKQTQAVVFLDGSAECSDIVIRDCKISGSSAYGVKSSRSSARAADRVLIEHTELFDCARTGFDIVGGDHWILRRNLVHGYGKSKGVSYGIFLKGGGEGGLIEGNVVDGRSRKGTVGISFGGGKTGERWLPRVDGKVAPEHKSGVARNNIVINTGDVAYHSNNAAGCRFLGNLAYGCSGFQRQGSYGEDPLLINNLIGRLRGAAKKSHHNLGAGQSAWFKDVETRDFRVTKRGRKTLRGKGKFLSDNPLDMFGLKRSRRSPSAGPMAVSVKLARLHPRTAWTDRR